MNQVNRVNRVTGKEIRRQRYLATKRLAFDTAVKAGPQKLEPLQPGERRLVLSREDFRDFIRFGDFNRLLDTNDLVTQMIDESDESGGMFAVTVVAKASADASTAAAVGK